MTNKFEQNTSNINALTQRVLMRQKEYLDAVPHLCPERSRLVTQSWKETEGEPLVIRKAKKLRKVLENQSIAIHDGELIVGSQTIYVRGTSTAPENDSSAPFGLFEQTLITTEGEIDQGKITAGGEVEETEVSDETRLSLLEDAEYWKGKSTMDQVKYAWKAEIGTLFDDAFETRLLEPIWQAISVGAGAKNPTQKAVQNGLNSIIAEAKERREALTFSDFVNDYHKSNVYQAMIIGCEAAISFANRYSGLAAQMAGKEKNAQRKKELEKISEICKRVPANPPENFHEAVQSSWILLLCLSLEGGGGAVCPGRMDQILYPYYINDIKNGTINPQDAAEILALYFIKLNEIEQAGPAILRHTSPMSQMQSITIGGVTGDGEDATNELSFLLLDVVGQVRMPQPAVHLAWHKGLNEDLFVKAAKTVQITKSGIPTFINGDLTTRMYTKKGVSLDDARKWSVEGCTGHNLPHLCKGNVIGTLVVTKVLELTLNNGIDPVTGRKVGLATGDPRGFKSFEELYDAFDKQVDHCVDIGYKIFRLVAAVRNQADDDPLASAMKDDCMEQGTTICSGNPRYAGLAAEFADRGCTDTADSLTAIKELVFDKKKITMEELLDALSSNFEGREDIHQMCLKASKYGNDNDDADDMFGRVSIGVAKKGMDLPNPKGSPTVSSRGAAAGHYAAGLRIGALPNGRKAWEPLNDAALSAMGGADVQGPTALINSATKARHTDYLDSLVLNMKFSPSVLSNDEGINKYIALIKTFFERSGWLVQFNVVSKENLEEAQVHPEKHQTLMVRVGGFSAYFVDLSQQIQGEVIRRTEHAL